MNIDSRDALVERGDRYYKERKEAFQELDKVKKELYCTILELGLAKDQIAELIEQRDQAAECIKARL